MPDYESVSTATTKVSVNGQMYAMPPVIDSALEYRSEETMEQLIKLIIAAREAIGKQNEKQAVEALQSFANTLPHIAEVVDFE